MAFGMQDYEQQVAACKESLFAELFQSRIHNLLEIGLGTGPNLKYYAKQKVSILYGCFASCRNKPHAKQVQDKILQVQNKILQVQKACSCHRICMPCRINLC